MFYTSIMHHFLDYHSKLQYLILLAMMRDNISTPKLSNAPFRDFPVVGKI